MKKVLLTALKIVLGLVATVVLLLALFGLFVVVMITIKSVELSL